MGKPKPSKKPKGEVVSFRGAQKPPGMSWKRWLALGGTFGSGKPRARRSVVNPAGRLTDDTEARAVLERCRYVPARAYAPRISGAFLNVYYLRCPDGTDRWVKLHLSGVASGPGGRHRYGINVEALKSADRIAFYALQERTILVVPCDYLLEILSSGSNPQLNNSGREWVVNIYFDRDGKHVLVPSNFHRTYSLDSWAIPVTAAGEGAQTG
jgi:hypothetical protein